MRFKPKTLKRLTFSTASREQGALDCDYSIHHVKKNKEIYSNQWVKKCANLLAKKSSLGVRG